MNIYSIKEQLKPHLNKKIKITVYGMRGKVTSYEGILTTLYPNIFLVKTYNSDKTFSYNDLITGEIKINYR